MHIADIDYISTHGRSFFHKARPISKVIFSVCLLTALIVSNELFFICGILAMMFVFTFMTKISLKLVCHLLLYPLFFSSIFAVIMMGQSINEVMVIIFRAISIAYVLIFLIMTTSYVELFGFFSIFMPALLIDVLIFTYRSFFILLESMTQLFKSIRLRGGYHPLKLITNLKNMASMIGILIIHSIDMSERMYHIYALRGYNGAIHLRDIKVFPLKSNDIVLMAIGILMITGKVIVWKL
ncbi:cobalt/nickel transport system permease protein [Natranaerovirga hydrolytica]|uniref:Cobalt/nickel transport system permease protein n=1 Tax=Natranaerovirga hydrolytica TaxID=680378 RepID=A0A4R1MZ02_9FIRM|nr:energy-coupling factor transporter transmembrane component T [Natranaerovirga hydrolytica]TCK97772.1 cobalt/nickel transport system permease protein [Natranaerovirga hydrolytica]